MKFKEGDKVRIIKQPDCSGCWKSCLNEIGIFTYKSPARDGWFTIRLIERDEFKHCTSIGTDCIEIVDDKIGDLF